MNYPGMLQRGIVLGIFASLSGSFLFLCIHFLFLIISPEFLESVSETFSRDDTQLQALFIFFLIAYWSVGLLVTFLVALLPGILGGASVARILGALSTSGLLTHLRGIVVGALVGGLMGYFAAQIGAQLMINLVYDFYSTEEEAQAIREIVASGVLAAVIAGAWHGWKMTQALKQI